MNPHRHDQVGHWLCALYLIGSDGFGREARSECSTHLHREYISISNERQSFSLATIMQTEPNVMSPRNTMYGSVLTMQQIEEAFTVRQAKAERCVTVAFPFISLESSWLLPICRLNAGGGSKNLIPSTARNGNL
jgi:hypothetical protein